MQVHFGLDTPPGILRSVVTTGTFDGVHIGHQVIIKRINELARELDGESVLITFHPHPRKVLYPDTLGKDIKMINTQREKIAMLETTGLDHLVIMPFTKEFAHTSSDQFIRQILVEKLNIKKSVVGFNHFFGFNKEGNYEQLYALGLELGFTVEEIPEQDIQNETVSSTKIRKAIEEGNIQRANAYLNHILMMMAAPKPDPFHSEVSIPFPAMLVTTEEEEKLLPPEGLYAVRIRQQGTDVKAVAIRQIRDDQPRSITLIPLEAGDIQPDPDTRILFYKQLVSGTERPRMTFAQLLESTLMEAEELIY